MPYAVLFPGQGSQTVGMGSDVFVARSDLLGAQADRVLGWSLRDVVMEGPRELLTATDRAQPALYAVSYALWEEFAMRAPMPAAAAGHSLGEYTALAAAGVFDFFTGLALVSHRGRAMAAAAALEPGAMAAVIGMDGDGVEKLASGRRSDGGQLWVANVNSPGQVVIAGTEIDVDWVVDHARELGVRRAIPLDVAGAFHTPLMAPAADDLAAGLSAVDFAPPIFPVYGNADAAPVTAVPDALRRQLTSPVRFEETLREMHAAGIDTFVHVGPGDVTAGLARRTLAGAAVHVVSDLEAVDEVVSAVS